MVNYGHRLEFGTFVTPANADPATPVRLAQLSEELGYDLVTFQDHPYQPSFLDTWTLLSWIAAQTETIRVSANVHNMALRPPAVLARAAASLDLLSGGRVDLGLGAGGFNDAVVAMGGPLRTPGESITALSEAIDVIRMLWDTSGSGVLRYDGVYHRLDGAKRGPAPVHDIPLWIGAIKPRMLRLVGRKGDGWLPSLPYVGVDGVVKGNAVIDEAATAAGRDPREIRRLLNISGAFARSRQDFLHGTSQDWVEDLSPLVVEHGVSTLIVMGDDPDAMRQFAEEVVPALREAADAELPHGSAGITVRPTSALAKRRAGIDYDAIPESLRAHAVEPGDREYRLARGGYLRGGSPGLVLRPGSASEVAEALAFARSHPGLDLGIRSGGHGISGRSTNDGGLVIDVSRLNQIEVVDPAARIVRIGAGARWGEVAAALAPHGWAISSGDYGGVGVGGLATAGGIGYLARGHGLTIDHVRGVEIVLADGTVARADDEHHPDLFWGVRGAGGNLGVVTWFDIEAAEVGDVGWGQLSQAADDVADYLLAWGQAMEAAPRDLGSFLITGAPRPDQAQLVHTMSVVDADDPDVVLERLNRIAALAPLVGQDVRIVPYAQVMANAGPAQVAHGEPLSRSGLLRRLTPEFARDAAAALATGEIRFFQIRSVGGAVADVPADATAYARRDANFSVVAMGTSARRMGPVWDSLHPHFDGLYLSFETDLSPQRLHDAFPPTTLARLRAVKRAYDPDHVFRHNFGIDPAG